MRNPGQTPLPTLVCVPGTHAKGARMCDETEVGLALDVLVRDGQRFVEDRDALVELLARDRQRRADHDHVPVGHQVEATVERRLPEPSHRRSGLARRVERHERLADDTIPHELEPPEAAQPAYLADRWMAF